MLHSLLENVNSHKCHKAGDVFPPFCGSFLGLHRNYCGFSFGTILMSLRIRFFYPYHSGQEKERSEVQELERKKKVICFPVNTTEASKSPEEMQDLRFSQ
jgi:hypothetical protein